MVIGSLLEIIVCLKVIMWVVINLIDNVWKYGGGEVELKVVVVDWEIWIEISDCGFGILVVEMEWMKCFFIWFELVCINVSGIGFGLVIVECVVCLYGGCFDLLSNFEGGLFVCLVLLISC